MTPTYLPGKYNQYWIYNFYSQVYRKGRQFRIDHKTKRKYKIIDRPTYVKCMRMLNKMILEEMIETGGYLKTETPVGNIQIIKYQLNGKNLIVDFYETHKNAKKLREENPNIVLKSKYNPDGAEFKIYRLDDWVIYFFWSKYISSLSSTRATKYYKFIPYSPYARIAKREWWYHLQEHIAMYEDYSNKVSFTNTLRYDSGI